MGSYKTSALNPGSLRRSLQRSVVRRGGERARLCIMNGILNTFSGKQHPQGMEGVAITKWLRIGKSTSWHMTLRADYFWVHLIPVGRI